MAFADFSTNNFQLTAFGNAQISTSVKKYGDGSALFDGNGDYLQTPNLFDFASQDWTIEFWLYANTQTDKHIIANIGPGQDGINIYIDGSSNITYNNGNTVTSVGASYTSYWNQWTHIALVRSGSTISMYVNGTLAGTPTTQTPGSNQFLYIGKSSYTGYDFTGYIDDLRITKGIARYTSNFTPPQQQLPAPSDPYADNVSLLLHMDGLSGSQSFTDSSSNNFTLSAFGNAQISTSVKKFGSGSGYFDGSGDYLLVYTNEEFSSGDWTTEMWIYPNDVSGEPRILSRQDAGSAFVYQLRINDGNLGLLIRRGDGSGFAIIGESVACQIFANVWQHIAITRNGNTISMYINGNSVASATFSGIYDSTLNPPWIIGAFADSDLSPQLYFNGYIDDLRITKGIARYTSNFTPPSAQLPTFTDPDFANVSLLLQTNRPFTDSSSNNFTLSAFGNAQISTSIKKFGTGSGYFDGSGDYLVVPYSSTIEPGSSDLTWEMWINTTNSTQYATLYSRSPASFDSGMWSVLMNSATTNGDVLLYAADYSMGAPLLQSTGVSIRDGAWHHIAIVRNGSNWALYIDGVSRATNTWSGTIATISNSGPFISRDEFYIRDFTGYIDDLRITKGVARYTSNFVPHTAPFVNPSQIPSGYLAF